MMSYEACFHKLDLCLKFYFFANQYATRFKCCIPVKLEVSAINFTCNRETSFLITPWIFANTTKLDI